MRSLSFHSDIRSVVSLPFFRRSLNHCFHRALKLSRALALAASTKKTKKKDSIALAPSFVFTVIIAGPFIRCATKEAQAAQSLLLLSIFLFMYDILCFQMSSLFSARSSVTFIILSKISLSRSARYLVPSLYSI